MGSDEPAHSPWGGALCGSRCHAIRAHIVVNTGERSVRCSDLTAIADAQADDLAIELRRPRVIAELLSPDTRGQDEVAKLAEHQRLASAECRRLRSSRPAAATSGTGSERDADLGRARVERTLRAARPEVTLSISSLDPQQFRNSGACRNCRTCALSRK